MEKSALEARDMGTKALAEIAAHTATCNVRQQGIDKRLDDMTGALRWINRQGILVLLTILGAILFELAKARGLL